MDEADLAFDSEQRQLAMALDAQRRRASTLKPVGCCHYCGNDEGVGERLFCDPDCAADWEYEHSLRKRLGLGEASTSAH